MAHFDLHKAPPRQQKKTILTFKESNNSKINQIYVKNTNNYDAHKY